ncbi:MAG: hypothetical protein LBG87_00925 [Spirochaetaceae bacterium]|nr:hypothetical protein [Spirochaetaceae bacterium]
MVRNRKFICNYSGCPRTSPNETPIQVSVCASELVIPQHTGRGGKPALAYRSVPARTGDCVFP